MPKHLDIFCGMGALSLGWEKAGSTPVLGVDIVEHAAKTYAANRPGVPTLHFDVAKLNPSEIRSVIGPVDVITGGVPCEPFSTARSGDPKQGTDPRKHLIKAAMRWVEAFQPKAFVFENVVPAVKSPEWQRAIKAIERKGYGVSVWKLIASDYGVPQICRRVFLIGLKGAKSDSMSPPEAHSESKTVRQAISDLGEPTENPKDPLHKYKPLSDRQKQIIGPLKPNENFIKSPHSKGGFSSHVVDPNGPSRTVVTSGVMAHWGKKRHMSLRELARIQTIPDSYKFPVRESSTREMLGDVVPVGLAHAVAKKVLSHITKAESIGVESGLFEGLADMMMPLPSPIEWREAMRSKSYEPEWLIDIFDGKFVQKEVEAQANESLADDEVKAGRFVWQPREPMQKFEAVKHSVDGFVDVFKSELGLMPAIVQKRCSGSRHQVHVVEGEAMVITSSGVDVTGERVAIAKAAESIGRDVVLDVMVDVEKGVAEVVDIMYDSEDIHMLQADDRMAAAEAVCDGEILAMAPVFKVTSTVELERAVRLMQDLPGSTGAVVKAVESTYPLGIAAPDGWAEYRSEGVCTVEKQRDPYMEMPPEGANRRYTAQHHWRGKSLHSDLRFGLRPDRMLIGWTINSQIPGAVKDAITSLGDAKRLARNMKAFSRIDWGKGEIDGQVFSVPKTPEPWPWMDVEGRTKDPEPGKAPPVGGTANFPGVYHIVDKGKVEWGAQKPDYHEYFLGGGNLKGRIVFREAGVEKAVPGGDEGGPHGKAQFMAVIPKDQTPHVLSGDAVNSGWMPPPKMSALPDSVKREIPDRYHYWTMGDKAKSVRDALVKAIKDGDVKITPVSKADDIGDSMVIECPIVKSEDEKRLVTGIVLEPNVVDAHNDIISPETIEKTAHQFLARFNRNTELGVMHKLFGENGLELVQSWIAPHDLNMNGVGVRKGTWLMTVKVLDDGQWRKVKAGELTGFSIGGVATVS